MKYFLEPESAGGKLFVSLKMFIQDKIRMDNQ